MKDPIIIKGYSQLYFKIVFFTCFTARILKRKHFFTGERLHSTRIFRWNLTFDFHTYFPQFLQANITKVTQTFGAKTLNDAIELLSMLGESSSQSSNNASSSNQNAAFSLSANQRSSSSQATNERPAASSNLANQNRADNSVANQKATMAPAANRMSPLFESSKNPNFELKTMVTLSFKVL